MAKNHKSYHRFLIRRICQQKLLPQKAEKCKSDVSSAPDKFLDCCQVWFINVANEAGESSSRPLARFARSKSQNALWNAITAGIGIKDKDKRGIVIDPRSPEEILADDLPAIDTPDAMEKTAIRLRCLVKQLERGEASVVDLKKNLEYAASVLESVYIEETRRLVDTEDELSDIQSDSVPSEVRDWLASTFTRQMGLMLRRSEEKPRFRSIVHAVQAGIFVERMYRRTSNMVGLSYPPSVITALKHVDTWSFDVFTLNDASGDHALKFIFYELLTRYDLINRFKIPISALVSFVEALEVGYTKFKNPYHNLIHAADVTQTVHYLLLKTGMVHWLTELEIFAMLFAAAVHDYEHTGTTNNFHIQTRSDSAILYNDRAVQENHHVSAAYRLLQDDDEMNILYNLSKDDWRDFRTLVVEMVLATDMSCHFQQIKAMKNFLQQPEAIDKPKALSLLLHTADISHPAKNWNMHHRWTTSLLEEFFRQGDKEAELGLSFSPLCDRKSTMVAQSQIGFIDFIVEPTFTVLTDMIEKIVAPLVEESSHTGLAGFRRSSLNNIPSDSKRSGIRCTGSEGGTSPNCSVNTFDFKSFRSTWNEEVHKNRETWKAQAAKDLEEKAKQDEIEEKQKKNNPAESSDTSEKGNNTKTQDKNNTDPSEKLQDKSKKDTRQDKVTNENDSKTREESGKATVDDTKPTELQPRDQEGNKDPGGGTEDQTPGSDAKEPGTSSDTDISQRAQIGNEDLNSPDSDDSESKKSDDSEEERSNSGNSPATLANIAAAASAAAPDAD
ncbi:dual specificity calcium/calmodulin-dependent 3',5'-cyclic nucleotide phosphodiesterase 1A isoform X2 [Misgurnus anguillicaudatus]|uniref:dual specificity calcium/calmodulin-dependent 3',5'-cyclic nucleotide phosphodiesterase 1A isoform X2 n=1 Tax=Misgurnus anguillicaudatus TaxID=75329 RepID=UPI003CCF64F3